MLQVPQQCVYLHLTVYSLSSLSSLAKICAMALGMTPATYTS